jgi:hypothetical protein
MSSIDFEAVKAAVSIEDAANVLKLSLKKTGNLLRGSCTGCGNEDERIVVITSSRGLFYCFDAKVGGESSTVQSMRNGCYMHVRFLFVLSDGPAVRPDRFKTGHPWILKQNLLV